MDIVERLRTRVMLSYNAEQVNVDRREGADEIERLRAENTQMRATLDGIRSSVNAWRELDQQRRDEQSVRGIEGDGRESSANRRA